jgi:hypothetical protein
VQRCDIGPEFDDEGTFAGFDLDAGEWVIRHGDS